MSGCSIIQDSMSDSTLSKNSGNVLIAKSPSKKNNKFEFKLSVKSKDNHHNGTEEQKDSFKWIPNPTDSILSETRQSTLESISSTTNSDFSSNGYKRSGYIRSNNLPIKYNEFTSLLTSLTRCPVEIKPPEIATSGKKDFLGPSCQDDELSVLLITGGIQMMLGILMAVFGVLIIVHNASLAGAGSGLWGGAVAMLSGLLGVLAGMKGCFASKSSRKVSPALLTAFLAMCLISFALSNLVLVLTSTGLIRDVNLYKSSEEQDSSGSTVDWPPVLSDAGLIVASVLQCIMAVISGYKCYRKVCPCSSGHARLEDSDSNIGTVKPDKKVSNWLGYQFTLPKRKIAENVPNTQWGTPNIVLLPPPPRMPTAPMPLWTFLQPPPSMAPSSHLYYCPPVAPPCCCHRESPSIQTIHTHKPSACMEDRTYRRYNYIQPDPKVPRETRKKRESRRERRMSAPSAEELAKTYTGRDREIAEEFIAIAMDKPRKRSRANSVGTFVRERDMY